jgi:putative sterol carrier protein
MVTRDLVVDDGRVTITPVQESSIDCTITCFEPLDQIRMIRGELNLVTGLLQGRLEAEGDPMLAVRIAGSIRELGTVTQDVR